jgi:hypothetical protein
MVPLFRRAFAVTLAALAAASFASACSNASGVSGAVGTSGEGASSILVTPSSRAVSVENRTGQSLVNVQVTIHQVGSSPDFLQSVASMDAGERKDLPLPEFHTKDKVTLNIMFFRPQQVVVTAHDQLGNNYNTTVPWK